MYENLQEICKGTRIAHGPIRPLMLIAGRVASPLDTEILAMHRHGGSVFFRLQEKSTGNKLSELSWAEIEDRLNCMMLAYYYDDYTQIKQHKVFAKVYRRDMRPVSYLENGLLTTRNCETYPCMICGIILPEHLVSLDHHHPQKGGELLALLKVFRACGLTQKEAWGSLGQIWLRYARRSYFDLAEAIDQGDDWPLLEPSRSAPHDADYEQRNSLTGEGILIYSLLVWSMDISRVIQNCMDSVLNLRPLCQSCNSSKSNKTYASVNRI